MDWHLYFDNSRCELHADGSCDTGIQSVGYRHPEGEPTPIMEVMPIQRWKRETTDYLIYSSTDWHLWSMDMTNAFLLKPGVASAVESFGSNKDEDHDTVEMGADRADIIGKEALAQGWLVVDRPDDREGHAHAELHPFQGLAVKTSYPGGGQPVDLSRLGVQRLDAPPDRRLWRCLRTAHRPFPYLDERSHPRFEADRRYPAERVGSYIPARRSSQRSF
jgi:hypothetical protein